MLASRRSLAGALVLLLFAVSVACSSQGKLLERGAAGYSTRRMTNAQRLARGLPPNKPVVRRRGQQKARDGASMTTSSTAPAPTACPVSGNIQLSDGLGFIDNASESDLNYPQEDPNATILKTTSDPSRYGVYTFDACAVPSGTPLCIECTNCPQASQFPCLGVQKVAGRSKHQCDSDGQIEYACYAFLTLTPKLAPGIASSGPTLWNQGTYYESDIWLYDSTTGALSAEWIQPDGNAVPLFGDAYLGTLDPSAPWYSPAAVPDPLSDSADIPVNYTFIPIDE